MTRGWGESRKGKPRGSTGRYSDPKTKKPVTLPKVKGLDDAKGKSDE
jgi:hypothetical protein